MSDSKSEGDIAIVGIALRFPGASTAKQFWSNLEAGIESVRAFTDGELLAAGASKSEIAQPRYVKAGVVLEEFDGFDAEFFGFSPKEAAILDPQHRQFLECAWEALEDAGHAPESFEGSIGVFGGCGMGAYFAFNLLTNRDLVEREGLFLLRHTGNDKDFLTTRVSYTLNLRGPSVSVQTACSTSLVATHLACQSLLSGECDMALAGGVTIEIPHARGYVYQPGEILSPDGHCRAFDHRAAGTIFGSGAGIVVLRRLEDARRDGDHVYAVIKGSAVNNDGSAKVGYLAPSVDGQAAAIVEAMAVAQIGADSIGYVECHGTGTAMGDPIEISALTQAFRRGTTRVGFCGIGSVKTNIGHLDTAAGVASLIKASLALGHRAIPPTLNFEANNPEIDFAKSPFFVCDRLRPWPAGSEPRRAAVNSLGVGGTNAFVLLEEAPPEPAARPSARAHQLLVLSAKSRAALDQASRRLAEHIAASDDDLADVAFTLAEGRRAFTHRRVVAAKDRAEAASLLRDNDPRRVFTHAAEAGRQVAFMLPGGGVQYPRMAFDLYRTEPVVREWMDRGFELFRKSGLDLAPLVFADEPAVAQAARDFERPSLQLPAIALVEHALAKSWMAWGVEPSALIGHSLGEVVAACLAEVMRFEDALGLVALRGRLMDEVPEGAMLSVSLPAEKLAALLGTELDLASVNAPELSVASGPREALEQLERTLASRGVESKWVPIRIAAHSRMLEPILGRYRAFLEKIRLSPPKIPIVSNRSGTWLTPEQATDPEYWVGQLRSTVLFADGIKTLLEDPKRILLEVGPGKTLGSLARQHSGIGPSHAVFSTLRHPDEAVADDAFFLTVFGRLWAAGADVDLARARSDESRRRVSLPTYCFQHRRYFIEPGKREEQVVGASEPTKVANLDDWFYRPIWNPAEDPPSSDARSHTWLVFVDQAGLGEELADRLRRAGHQVVCVRQSDAYYQLGPTEYRLSPEHGRDGYDALVRDLVASGKLPDRIVHLWLVGADGDFRPGSSVLHRNQERGFYSLLFLAQALADQSARRSTHVVVVSSGMQQVDDEAVPYPDQATVLGPCKVIPRELAGFTCSSVDVTMPAGKKSRALDRLSSQLMNELGMSAGNRVVAIRGGRRFEQAFEKVSLDVEGSRSPLVVRSGGTYLITGGLGGIGLTIARHLATRYHAKLVLVSRSKLPDAAGWDAWLGAHDASDPTSRRIAALREIEAAGSDVRIISADVTDLERMRQGLEAAERRLGPIRGVFHAAGVMKDELIQTKTQASIESVLAPKVYGTLVLDSLLDNAPLDFFFLFSSTSTVTGNMGQIDYVAANAFLNAYAQSRRRPRSPERSKNACKTIAIDWGIWSEIGMAADAAASLVSDEARASAPMPVPHPLLQSRASEGDRHIFSGSFAPGSQWILNEHRTLDGRALVPGTAYLEIARAALAEVDEKGAFEIEDLFFLRPLFVADDRPREVRAKLRPNARGYDFEVQSRTDAGASRQGWELHAQGKIVLGASPAAATLDLDAIARRCEKRVDRNPSGVASRQEDHLRFGPRWRSLHEAAYGEGEALGRLELPQPFTSDLATYGLHPAIVDVATGFAMDLIEGYDGRTLWVPVSYGRVEVRAPLPARVASWVKARSASPSSEFASFDIVLTNESGSVLAVVDELTLRKLPAGADFGVGKEPTASEVELEAPIDRAARTKSPAELAFVRQLEQGITQAEGCAVVDRVLAKIDGPVVVASSLDLIELAEAADRRPVQPMDSGTKFARPELSTSYLAPRDDIERTLVEYWQELLGVDKVGVEDSFFDLGGHSLVAVRLFAKIKSAYRVEYPISVLFEAPTIARCAALIKSAVGDDGVAARETPDAHRTRYTHLVAMHHALGKRAEQRAPFFLVAGMFGNVLNLRHLANLIGQDRRFYGLQARGLYGDHTPHETFEAMASDYIAELRTVQPAGPYLLGGFSGGGITAYEMARQLILAGERIALLVLLDTPLPFSPPLTSRDRWMLHLYRLRENGASHLLEWAKNRYAWERNEGQRRTPQDLAAQTPFDFHSEAIEAAFRRACASYTPAPLPLPVTLFRPKLDEHAVLGPGRVINRERRFVYHDNGWGRYVKAVDVYEVPGDHDSMVLEPNVRVVATRLRECIQRAESYAPTRDVELIVPSLADESGAAANDTAAPSSIEVIA
jgi:acyl transferase domain-containing protein/thioesterase domain-containing protein/acyl carrier protein